MNNYFDSNCITKHLFSFKNIDFEPALKNNKLQAWYKKPKQQRNYVNKTANMTASMTV